MAATSLALSLTGCGGSDPSSVVARVGDRAITKAEVDRWTGAVMRGGAFTGLRGSPRAASARERALALLISSDWLIGEAKRRGLAISTASVSAALEERAAGASQAAFGRRLARRGQTIAGLRFELMAELTLDAILQEVGERAGRISHRDVSEYYRKHKDLFSEPEARVIDIAEGLPSEGAAKALIQRSGTGPGFTRAAYHKRIAHTPGVFLGPADKKRVDYAIFSARPGVVSRPMRLEGAWSVFVVRKIVPPKAKAFAEVQNEVFRHLAQSRPRELKAALSREFETRWRAKTSCREGYIAPGCPQYQGTLGEYEDPFSDRP